MAKPKPKHLLRPVPSQKDEEERARHALSNQNPGDANGHGHEHDHKHVQNADTVDAAAFLNLIYQTFSENQRLREAYSRLLGQAAQALVKTLELRDPYTYGHSMRVMEYAMMIGRGAKLGPSEMHTLELSAMFHDIGKVGVPDCVLLKPGRLNSEEQAIINQHPVKSAEIIEIIDEFKKAAPGVKHHHERYDGEGYPSRLSGMEIPIQSRIILVADTFDAMTSDRPYRKALPIEAAYEELKRFSGAQFDPGFVRVFLEQHQKLFVAEPEIQKRKKAA